MGVNYYICISIHCFRIYSLTSQNHQIPLRNFIWHPHFRTRRLLFHNLSTTFYAVSGQQYFSNFLLMPIRNTRISYCQPVIDEGKYTRLKTRVLNQLQYGRRELFWQISRLQ